jgi:hypothetical protein
MAGSWLGENGLDVHPTVDGPVQSVYIERYELEPIDPQTNGPQLFYGLRYHTRITQPGDVAMFHEQVGFWLWEPASGTVVLTLAIPRGQVAMATGQASKESRQFTLKARRGSKDRPLRLPTTLCCSLMACVIFSNARRCRRESHGAACPANGRG